jgi:ribosome-binding factor A
VPELLERLARRRGPLRAEVAASLQRKRTPELFFRVAGASS